jgi:hypothetical protein
MGFAVPGTDVAIGVEHHDGKSETTAREFEPDVVIVPSTRPLVPRPARARVSGDRFLNPFGFSGPS